MISDLPEEIGRLIVEHLQRDTGTLRSLCLVSSQFRTVTEPVLYREIFFRTGQECTNLLRNISARDERALSIRNLDARCEYGKEEGLNCFPEVLRKASNLRELTVESPCANDSQYYKADDSNSLMECMFQPLIEGLSIKDVASAIHRPLRTLKKLTLHWNGQGCRHWMLDGSFGAIFMHPGLTDLTISCVTIPDHALDNIEWEVRTPLQYLNLTECNIGHSGLHSILSKPRALESLYLGRFENKGILYP